MVAEDLQIRGNQELEICQLAERAPKSLLKPSGGKAGLFVFLHGAPKY